MTLTQPSMHSGRLEKNWVYYESEEKESRLIPSLRSPSEHKPRKTEKESMVPQETPEYRKKSRLRRHHHDRRLDSPPGPHARNIWLDPNADFVSRRGNWTSDRDCHISFIFSLDVQA